MTPASTLRRTCFRLNCPDNLSPAGRSGSRSDSSSRSRHSARRSRPGPSLIKSSQVGAPQHHLAASQVDFQGQPLRDLLAARGQKAAQGKVLSGLCEQGDRPGPAAPKQTAPPKSCRLPGHFPDRLGSMFAQQCCIPRRMVTSRLKCFQQDCRANLA